ncbi:MAG: sigma-70 family RNA polymerase sigma factor [Clostridium sp.]|nr:sigma-70 family RNA polymerase sigma factor [Clostridium sp.]
MNLDFLLVEKIKNGDNKAAEGFVKKYYSSICQYCFLHIHDRYIAEDMTQETFLRFFETINTYTEQGKVRNYLYCIAGNCIKNYCKKKKEILLDDTSEMLEESISDIESRLDIEQAVDGLPEVLRETAILFFFQNLKQREIADLLQVSLPLVKYRIREIRKILSKKLHF